LHSIHESIQLNHFGVKLNFCCRGEKCDCYPEILGVFNHQYGIQ